MEKGLRKIYGAPLKVLISVSLIRTVPSALESHQIGFRSRACRKIRITVGGEFHPAPKHIILCQSAPKFRRLPSPESQINYSAILVTTPEPTVWPPSRIAKRRPSSIAIGVMSSTLISTLSPGIHISTPSSRVMVPVTSVVRK